MQVAAFLLLQWPLQRNVHLCKGFTSNTYHPLLYFLNIQVFTKVLLCCRTLHYIHHKYNKEHTLSPFAGLAFHPLDGILQVRHPTVYGHSSYVDSALVGACYICTMPHLCDERLMLRNQL